MNSAVLVILLFRNESHMSRIGLTWISECLIMHQKVWVILGAVRRDQHGMYNTSIFHCHFSIWQLTTICLPYLLTSISNHRHVHPMITFLLIINGHFILSITETSSFSKSQKLLWASYALLCLTWSGLYMNDLIYRLESLSW